MRYRKRPVEVDAVRLGWDTWSDVTALLGDEAFRSGKARGVYLDDDGEVVEGATDRMGLLIETLEGTMLARQGDYIVRGVRGECYPVKPDIFEEIYEPAEET